jgi:hypothetical protein
LSAGDNGERHVQSQCGYSNAKIVACRRSEHQASFRFFFDKKVFYFRRLAPLWTRESQAWSRAEKQLEFKVTSSYLSAAPTGLCSFAAGTEALSTVQTERVGTLIGEVLTSASEPVTRQHLLETDRRLTATCRGPGIMLFRDSIPRRFAVSRTDRADLFVSNRARCASFEIDVEGKPGGAAIVLTDHKPKNAAISAVVAWHDAWFETSYLRTFLASARCSQSTAPPLAKQYLILVTRGVLAPNKPSGPLWDVGHGPPNVSVRPEVRGLGNSTLAYGDSARHADPDTEASRPREVCGRALAARHGLGHDVVDHDLVLSGGRRFEGPRPRAFVRPLNH